MKARRKARFLVAMVLASVVWNFAGVAMAAPQPPVPPLSAEGEKLLAAYTSMLDGFRKEIVAKLPAIDPKQSEAFLAVYAGEKGKVTSKPGAKKETRKGGDFSDAKAEAASIEAAKPILAGVQPFLASDAIDPLLVKATVLATATPRGLAAFAEQGADHKKLVDSLLADPSLMRDMLLAGGAKAGRYGKAMEILRAIEAASPKAKEGVFHRLALATALELAAPEQCGYDTIDPVARYAFFEKSYLDKQLDPAFDDLTTWELRHVVNDPHTEADMAWMREMLWNYRPDHITAPDGYRARYVGLMNSEFGHKAPEWDDQAPTTKLQQTIDRGSQCGPKAFFGRCLARSFGIPVWGARLRSHTAMAYWTPQGWTTILGVAWKSGFWTADAEPMRALVFRLEAMARECPEAFLAASRARWIGAVLGEEKLDGMQSGTGGLWTALGLNHMRRAVVAKDPPSTPGQRPWETDSYAKDAPDLPEKLMTPEITAADRSITTNGNGTLVIPAVACTSPTGNTAKIVFMKGRDGRMQLHWKRYELPEAVTYEVTAPKAGSYRLTADVVTVNREQFFTVAVNSAKPVEMKMPYTVGMWGTSDPITVTLAAGKNTLTFNRTAPEDFQEKGWSRAGPEYGGITVRSLSLEPVR